MMDSPKLTAVLVVIPSPKKNQVRKVNETIPIPNAMNLPGHNIPSKYSTVNLVA